MRTDYSSATWKRQNTGKPKSAGMRGATPGYQRISDSYEEMVLIELGHNAEGSGQLTPGLRSNAQKTRTPVHCSGNVDNLVIRPLRQVDQGVGYFG